MGFTVPMFASFSEWLTLSGWRRARSRRRIWDMAEDLFLSGPQELRLARRWRLRLALACQTAEARVGAVLADLDVHHVCRGQWTTEPAANALFATAEELEAFLLSPAAGLRQYFLAHQTQEAFFAITATPDLRTSFGTRMQGDILLRDERVETLTFRDHRLLEPQSSLSETRAALRRGGLRFLVSAALHHIIQEKLHRKELAETRAVLATKHKALSLQLRAMHGLIGASKESQAALDDLATLVAELDHDIREVDVTLGRPEDVLQEVDGFLRAPRQFLHVETVQLRLTRDGEVVPPETSDAPDSSGESWPLTFTRFAPVDGRPPRAMFLCMARREEVLGKEEEQKVEPREN
ncbi:hypothetical protein [Megalodesulfovibrio paquesii]